MLITFLGLHYTYNVNLIQVDTQKMIVQFFENIYNICHLLQVSNLNLYNKYIYIYIYIYMFVGSKDLNFYVGSQAPITNKSTFEEEKRFGKAS